MTGDQHDSGTEWLAAMVALGPLARRPFTQFEADVRAQQRRADVIRFEWYVLANVQRPGPLVVVTGV